MPAATTAALPRQRRVRVPAGPTPNEVMIALNAHLKQCALFNGIQLSFMGAVLTVLVMFAGYSYIHDQQDARDLMDAKLAALNAVHQTASETSDQTVSKLKAAQAPAP